MFDFPEMWNSFTECKALSAFFVRVKKVTEKTITTCLEDQHVYENLLNLLIYHKNQPFM